MNEFFANVIWLLHIAFILFYTIVPFTDIHKFPELHILMLATGPLLWVHWLCNSDECSLTRLELMLRGDIEKRESFFYNLVSPIYQPTDDRQVRQIMWAVSIGLWLVTLSKFIKNPCIFKNFFDRALGRTPSHKVGHVGDQSTVIGVVTSSGVSEDGMTVLSKQRVLTKYISEPSRFSTTVV